MNKEMYLQIHNLMDECFEPGNFALILSFKGKEENLKFQHFVDDDTGYKCTASALMFLISDLKSQVEFTKSGTGIFEYEVLDGASKYRVEFTCEIDWISSRWPVVDVVECVVEMM